MNEFNEVILLKFGEVVLKGLNRNRFETLMIKDLSSRLKKLGRYTIESRQSILYVIPENDAAKENFEKAVVESTKVFGIAAVSRALCVDKDMNVILDCVKTYCKDVLKDAKTFKVEARRSDKDFYLKSPEICKECGGAILSANPRLRVDVNNPDVAVRIEIRQKHAYINCGAIPGAGGMPYSSAGKGLLLLSGGIDSPVAGYMCAKRGVKLDALHFESYPYTSIQAREKVIELASQMQDTCGKIRLTIASVTENAIVGGLLAILVLFLFLGNARNALVIGVSMPVSVVTTFIGIIAFIGTAILLYAYINNTATINFFIKTNNFFIIISPIKYYDLSIFLCYIFSIFKSHL